MRLLGLALVIGLALTDVTVAEASTADPVARLNWLAGSWGGEDGGRWTEEQWTAARGGLMLGVNRSGKGDKAVSFEFLRIGTDKNGTVTLWAAPSGKQAVSFRAVAVTPNSATFENPAHDFPTRITYRRTGTTLTATISGPEGRNSMSWTWRRR